MKKIRINSYQIGLVFKNDAYERMLNAGSYWLWPSEKVMVYDMTRQFVPPVELNILLQDVALKELLEVVEVWDQEIVVLFENGLLKQVLTPGRYVYWKSVIYYAFIRVDLGKIEISENLSRTTLQNKLLVPYIRSYSIESYEKALLFVDGKCIGPLESGVHYWWKNGIVINVGKVDTRLQQIEVNGQEILTRDKAALRLNAWAQYKVTDIEKALLSNKEYDKQLYVAFQLVLREYIGGLHFDELLERKEQILPFILEKIAGAADILGVQVTAFGIRDISECKRS